MRDRASPHKAADKWGLAKLSCCNQQNKNHKNKKKLKKKNCNIENCFDCFFG